MSGDRSRYAPFVASGDDTELSVRDRIVTYYQVESPSPLLQDVLTNWSGYLCGETLTVELVNAAPPEGAFVEAQQVEGEYITLGVKVAR